uniref:Uncharacterized protein n=1 Tax=Chromera velia CCMP2878 TaxID=1169474 RepID=A0A0G4HCQ9_9ALVE|eukprot:Cvel_6297.t1-p1 / transcript=Cvel_6297.t1 / gene=Cvel_6297 / organism=Chromera_velia_CCMP2878 / gene_product=MOB kinase activator 1B, putative / transcript_product=MOB kinase activator 1B, putative / location=Cvel_scaffold305:93345-97027(+) / protein_length=305 / sequence_SO=supercontig / SO=protein_coding / is_pseudo=false
MQGQGIDWAKGRTAVATQRNTLGFPQGSTLALISANAKATLGMGNLKLAVKKPPNVDQDEWIAVKTMDMYNEVGLLWSATADFCTDLGCPIMAAGTKFEYRWAFRPDRPPEKISAPQYMEHLVKWCDAKLRDTTLFPIEPGVPFPPHFRQEVSGMLRRIFRVYAHVYYHHFKEVQKAGAEAHLNCCFKHFLFFVREFNLVSMEDLEPLKALVMEIERNYPDDPNAETNANANANAAPGAPSQPVQVPMAPNFPQETPGGGATPNGGQPLSPTGAPPKTAVRHGTPQKAAGTPPAAAAGGKSPTKK